MLVSGARLMAVARINPLDPAPVRMNACSDGECAIRTPVQARAAAASRAVRKPALARFTLSSASNAGFALPIATLLGKPERLGAGPAVETGSVATNAATMTAVKTPFQGRSPNDFRQWRYP